MSKACCCEHDENRSSSFVFGLILGAIIGAIIAIVIYKKNKGKVFDNLQKKLEDFFKNFINLSSSEPQTVPVVIKPKKIIKSKKVSIIKPVITSKPAPVATKVVEKKIVSVPVDKPVAAPTPIKKKAAPKMFVKPRR